MQRLLLCFLLLLVCPNLPAEPKTLTWDDLLPEGEKAALEALYAAYFAEVDILSITEGSDADQMLQLGNFTVIEELDGQEIRMPGFIVPFDFAPDNQYREFLLVPYFGACLHTPPPPPNQIVYVTRDEAIEIDNIWTPFWVTGTMRTTRHENDLGNAAYTLQLDSMERYEPF